MPVIVAAVTAAASAIGAALGTAVVGSLTVGQLLVGAYMVYGAVKQRRMERQARQAYNDRLTDRTVTYSDADAPWQVVYGTATVGGRIVAQLTSGERDEFQHLVVVWADHECDAITDIKLGGKSVGALGGSGYLTEGKWFQFRSNLPAAMVTLNGSASGTLPLPPDEVLMVSFTTSSEGGVTEETLTGSQVSVSGSTVTVLAPNVAAWAGRTVQVSYRSGAYFSRLRIKNYLGAPGQVADPTLIAECPGQWSSTDVLAGKCYSIIRYDLNEPEFQGGPLQPTATLRGKKVLKHRTGTTGWSENPADCIADFLMAEYGKAQPSGALIWSSFDATANVCDETSYTGGAARFTCNGAFTTDADPDETLTALCQSMGGFATFTGAWHLQAAAYTAPVMDLTDADNAGAVQVLPTPEGQEMFNGMRGQFYDPERFGQRTDYTPYRNAAFVSDDGGEEWGPLNLPFTVANWRCTNLARIQVERSRAMQVLYPAKMRALRLRVGQRVRLSCTVLNMDAAVFRVVRKEFRIGGPVLLTLAQDGASMYDEADAPAALTSPTAPSLDPWVVPPVLGLAVVSSDAVALRDGDGTVISRARVTWSASTNPYVLTGGALQIEYRLAADTQWTRGPDVTPSAEAVHLLGLLDGRGYVLRARWRNGLGATSDWAPYAFRTVVPSTAGSTWDTLTGRPADSAILNSYVPISKGTMNADPGCEYSAAWAFVSGAVLSVTTASAAVGRGLIRYPGGVLNSMAFTAEAIPINPARRYRLTARLVADTGNDRHMYVTVRMFRADNTELTGADTGWGGSYAGYVFGGMPTTSWAEQGADFGAGTGFAIPADVAYVRVGVWGQYTAGSSSVDQYAQDVRLVEVTDVRTAQAAAATAATAAGNAQTAANTANTALAAIASDNVLTAGEKPAVMIDYTAITDELSGIDARAAAYGITTERTAYTTAVSALGSYLTGLSPGWNNTAVDTPIVGTTFRAKFADVYSTRQAVLNAIAAAAGTVATWAGVTGSGKPADGATKNIVSYSASAPGSPVDGDVWVDTSGTPSVVKVRVLGAWVAGANLSTGLLAELNDVGTTHLQANAATKVTAAAAVNITVDGQTGVPTGDFTTLVSITFTPTVTCEVLITVDGDFSIATPSSGSPTDRYASLSTRLTANGTQLGNLRNYAVELDIGFSAEMRGVIARTQRLSVTGGTAYTVVCEAQKLATAVTTTVLGVAMRIEEIRR